MRRLLKKIGQDFTAYINTLSVDIKSVKHVMVMYSKS
jgi:hypothetical protein